MNSSDILVVLQWWITLLAIGLAFMPLTLFFFNKFFDKGYIFSKVLGMAVTTYAIYLLGIIHFVAFNNVSAWIIFVLSAIAAGLLVNKNLSFIDVLKPHWKFFAFEELVFLIALFIWCYIHSFNPDIHGLEKYMDYGFINSALRTDYFPPRDMWFPPEAINYYYFGHIVTAVLIKLANIPVEKAFNIMLSTIFAFCLTQTFSIGANLFSFSGAKISKLKYRLKLLLAGLLTAFLTTLGGNLHIIYAFFKPYQVDHPKPVWELAFTPMEFPNAYWYPNATRYIYNTIHEFPIYSWVVADLHGHVLDIPFVLLVIALLLSVFVNADPHDKKEKPDKKWQRNWLSNKSMKDFVIYFAIHPLAVVLLGFFLAVMYMTNAWDGAIYLLLAGLVLLYVIRERHGIKSLWTFLGRFFVPMALIATFFLLFTFPYNYHFKPFVSGIGILCAPQQLTKMEKLGPLLFEADHCQHSYWWELLMLYGFFYFFVISFLFYLSFRKKIARTDIFVLILIVLGTLLIIIPEFIYVKDIYPAHYRANTMFKLVFQSFIMLSLTVVYIINRISQTKFRIPFLLCSLILISLVMTYPYLAVGSYYGDISDPTKYKGLNGISYLNVLYPSDYEGIIWLNTHITGQPVILEAQGDSYTDYARVSSNTGLPTILGWTVHEWLWRGDYGIPAPRITEVTSLYETSDINAAKDLLKKYKVQYVFIGALEKQKYPKMNEEKFKKLGKVVFQQGDTKIYEVTQ